MTILVCAVCGREFDPAHSDAMPFCSKRCRQVDLGRWLNEEYGLPVQPDAEDGPDEPYSDDID